MLGDLLRSFRESAGLSQEELAERAEMSVSGVSALERGERKRPYPHTLRRLADALGLAEGDRGRLIAAARGSKGPAPAPTQVAGGTSAVFVGRGRELDELTEVLVASRLVTLLGMGGVGKSRLAEALVQRRGSLATEGAFIVDLEALVASELVTSTIATVCGVREEAGAVTLDALTAWIGERELLLVLDGCEKVLEATGEVCTHLIGHCPGLRILATSQEPLNLSVETLFSLGPMDLSTPAGIEAATALFDDRARATGATSVDPGAKVIEEICRRLDGIPLAIEFAAAWSRLMSPAAILKRLDDPLGFLVRSTTDAADRRKTLRAALEHTHALLDPDEEVVFRRLGVFTGGFSIDAFEVVCGTAVEQSLLGLAHLVDLSLVVAEGDDRFKMLDPVLRFAKERLIGTEGESDAIHDAHAHYFMEFAEDVAPAIKSTEQQTALDAIENEIDNLRAALNRFLQVGETGSLQRLVSALGTFWYRRGYIEEGLGWVRAATDGEHPPTEALIGALYGGLWLTWQKGDEAEYRRISARLLSIADNSGDLAFKALFMHDLAMIDSATGTDDVTPRLQKALDMAREAGDPWTLALVLNDAAQVGPSGMMVTDDVEALEEARSIARSVGDPWLEAVVLDSIARAELARGDTDAALKCWQEFVDVSNPARDPWLAIACLEGVAELALIEGDPARCLHLLGLAARARARSSIADMDWLRSHVREIKETAERLLSTEEASAAWDRGSAQTLEQALSEAFEVRA